MCSTPGTAAQVNRSTSEDGIASLEAKLARLEAEATRNASLMEPHTAHSPHRDYDELCEEIISLKRHRDGLLAVPDI